jgi:PIN domain nuclease of toxin-antitoxin system
MRILLDTHMLLWWLSDDPKLPGGVLAVVTEPRTDVYVSAISMAEIAIKISLGKLRVDGDIGAATRDSGFSSLPFTADHASLLRDLPWHHRDPFDRMLIARALAEGLTLSSVDGVCAAYGVPILR